MHIRKHKALYRSSSPLESFLLEEEMRSNSNWRMNFVSLVGILLSIFMVSIGVIGRNGSTLSILLKSGEVYNIIAELLISIGGAIFTLFAISLIWELYIRRSWLREMRLYIFKTLCSPQASNYTDTTEWQLELLKQIMSNQSEPRISTLLHKKFEDKTLSPLQTRKNFHYEMVLHNEYDDKNTKEAMEKDFYKADIEIKYRMHISQDDAERNVRVVFQKDSNMVSDPENQTSSTFDKDIYRYVFLTNNADKLGNIPAIEVTSAQITHKRININYETEDKTSESNIILLKIPEAAKTDFRSCVGEECEVSLKMKGYVDKSYPFYSMTFGYPIDTFTMKFSIVCKAVSGVYLSPFFNSEELFIHDGNGSHEGTCWVTGHINGLSIPNSSLLCVWKYKHEE